MSRRITRILPLALLLLVYAGYVLYPFGAMIAETLAAGTEGALQRYGELFSPANAEAVWNSVYVSILSVFFSAVVGTLLAFVFTQCRFPFRVPLSRIAVLPIAMPPLVGVIAFLFVFGESGILPRLVNAGVGLPASFLALDGISAIVAVHTYSFYVYFYLFVSTALRSLDASQIEAAQMMGSSMSRTLRKIVLPELKPAMLGAAILTFMASMASFSAPLIFGGENRFMTLQIYNAKLNGEMDSASALAVALTAVSVGFFIILKILGPQRESARTKGVLRQGLLPVSELLQRVLIGSVGMLIAIGMLPILTIIIISFATEGSWTWQIFPSDYTLGNYIKLLQDPQVFQPVGNSLLMSVMALAGTLAVGVPMAFLITKGELQRSRFTLDVMSTLPFAIPGTVIAIGLILAFNSPTLFTGYEVLVGTFWILPLAYAIRTFPMVVRSTSSSLERLDDSLLEAGKMLGAGVVRRFRKIVLPVILPGVIAGSLLVMITALGEFVSSILLYTYSNRPIAIEILAQMRSYNFGGAAAYSVFLLVLIYGMTWLANIAGGKSEKADTTVNL